MRTHEPPNTKNDATNYNLSASVEVSSEQVSSIDVEQLLVGLNAEQLNAVEHDPLTPLQILAGPGSGKTKVLTSRIAQLILSHELSPSSICAVTFTNKAANEMRDRLTKIIGKPQTDSLQMGTFHSLCAKFLRMYARKVRLQSNFTICDADESKKLIAGLLKPYKEYLADHDITLREGFVASAISKAKAKGHSAATYSQEVELLAHAHTKSKSCSDAAPQEKKGIEQIMADVYNGYERILKQNNALDFDDLLIYGVKLFSQYEECVSWCKHMLVDEFQDTNAMQYELMKAIATRRCITVVGDPDQSIYGWRSAEVVNLSKMRSDFPTTRQIFLEQNYRSTASILKTSLAIVQEDKQRIQKSLYTSHPAGSTPVIREFESEKIEAAFIAFEIKRCVASMGGALRWGDFVVLLRFNALSRPIESALQKEGIPCRILGGHKFFERMEVKDLLSYLQLADNPNFNPSFIRAIKAPSRGVGDKTLSEIATRAEALKISQMQLVENIHDNVIDVKPPVKRKITSFVHTIRTLRKLDANNALPSEMIRRLVDLLNYEDYLRKTQPDWESRWENVQELITFASEVESEVPTALQEAEDESGPQLNDKTSVLRQFLQASMLSSEGDNQSQEESQEKVTLSTCHAAKGLEWPVVIIPSVDNDTFPFYRTEDIEEERRLLYVACTRAQSLLYLSHSLQRQVAGKTTRKKISDFISAVQSKNKGHFSHDTPRFLPQDRAVICKVLGRRLPDQVDISKCTAQLGSNGVRLPSTFQHTDGGFSAINMTGINPFIQNEVSICSVNQAAFHAPGAPKIFEASFVSASSVAQKMQTTEGLSSNRNLNTSETDFPTQVEVAARRNASDRQASKQDSRQLTLDQKWLSSTHNKAGTIIMDAEADMHRIARSKYKQSLTSTKSMNSKSAPLLPTSDASLASSSSSTRLTGSNFNNPPPQSRSDIFTSQNSSHAIHTTPSFHGSKILSKTQTSGLSIGSNNTRPLNSENYTPMPLRSKEGPTTGALSGINKTSVNYDISYIEGAAKSSQRLPPLSISHQTQQPDVIIGHADAVVPDAIGVSNISHSGHPPGPQTAVKRRLGMGRTTTGYSNKKFKRPVL